MISQLYWLYIEGKMLRVNLIGRIRVFWGLRSGTGLSFTFGSWSGSFSRVVSGWSGSTPPGSATLSETPTLTFYTNPCSMYSPFLTTLYFCLSFPSFTFCIVNLWWRPNGSNVQRVKCSTDRKLLRHQILKDTVYVCSLCAQFYSRNTWEPSNFSIGWAFDSLKVRPVGTWP